MEAYTDFIEHVLRDAGTVVRDAYGTGIDVSVKQNRSHVVTRADTASENLIVSRIREAFPDDGIVTEETGYHAGTSGVFWIADPLDGTSNFSATIPWFAGS